MLVYADDVNLLGANINNINKNTLSHATGCVVLEANADKTKYMLPSRHQNAEKRRTLNKVKKLFENVKQFK
jgi:hypothetical protein